MKFTINGFSQQKLIDYGLDTVDSLILRWFIDFKDTGKMKSFIIDNDKYYWIMYDYVIQEMPILNIKKDMLYRKLRKMVKSEILKNKTKRTGGTYSLYTLGENYKYLICDNKNSDCDNNKHSENIPTNIGKYSDECRKKLLNKDSSINDYSIIDHIYNRYPTKCYFSPRSTGKSQKCKDKIKTLLKTHTEDELIEIIDLYLENCKKSNTYLKNFMTFLNNLPELSDLKNINYETDEEENTDYPGNSTVRFHQFWDDIEREVIV